MERSGSIAIEKLEAILFTSVLSAWFRKTGERLKGKVKDSSNVCGKVQRPADGCI